MTRPYITDKEFILPLLRKDPAFLAAYINEALKEDPRVLKRVLRDVVDAGGGVGKLAKATGLGRPALYRMLAENGNPEYTSIEKILHYFNLTLGVLPLKGKRHHFPIGSR